jgi:2-succinyl-5-enolpyruvyl-6-hydroxy-3-cyclohexene-1-carboxylate synthase
MNNKYSSERNVQILIGLMKANGITKVVASPGTTNIPFVMSLQNDGGFEIYSCVDERSAAYMAVGLSAESGEPVVLTCTGATASRNYMSGLTEAYYRRLPILAVTSTRPLSSIGNHVAQVIDRTVVPNDIVKLSVFAPLVRCANDEWDCQLKINRAMAALKKNGGGPVHINLETESSFDFSVPELKNIHAIEYITAADTFPAVPEGRVAIYIGSHQPFTKAETEAIDTFCEKYNGAVYCDHTSNYKGKYGVLAALMGAQDQYMSPVCHMDLMIYIGDVTGAYEMGCLMPKAKTLWRVAEDGEMRDPSRSLSKLFHLSEIEFFSRYAGQQNGKSNVSFYQECRADYDELCHLIPSTIPLSNIWVAKEMAPKMPANSVMHFSILNSLRAWEFFEVPSTVSGYSNVGGFGIDGCTSALIGASFCHPDKLYFGVVGDLSFFYDMNSLGNRHVSNNVRLLVVNNGKGMEFRNYTHPASQFDNTIVDQYISAGGHFGQQSRSLLKDFAINLGYEYLRASTKEEFKAQIDRFLDPSIGDKPIVFEVFTEQDDENEALRTVRNLKKSADKMAINMAKKVITNVAGKETLTTIKNIIRKR